MTMVTLIDAWERLCSVQGLQFTAKSRNRKSGLNGTGTGTVTVTTIDNSTIIFTEHGKWTTDSGLELVFDNTYRWTLIEDAGTVRLEHLRFGPNRPVFLLDLVPTNNVIYKSVSPHCCGTDSYTAIMEFKNDLIYVRWHIEGPGKDADICYIYTQHAGRPCAAPDSDTASRSRSG